MKTKTFLLALLFAGTTGLFAQHTKQKTGGDRDVHDCIVSAGYTYSQLKKECIRSFEQKIQLKEIATQGNYNAAVLFNKDQSKAEIFLKEEKKSLILKRTAKKVWKNTQHKGFVLFQNKKSIYKSTL
jgi:hypothetical protein